MNSISDPGYSDEPAGGGAESIPDPAAPEFEEQPDQASAPGSADGGITPGEPVLDAPVMDGALDDMSDGGTPKAEANDMQEEGTLDQAQPGESVLEDGLGESVGDGLDGGLAEGPVERGEVKG